MQKSEHDRLIDRLCTEPPDVLAKLLGELKRPITELTGRRCSILAEQRQANRASRESGPAVVSYFERSQSSVQVYSCQTWPAAHSR